MSLLIDLFLFLLVVVFFPYIVVGLVIGKVLVSLAEVFHLPALFAALSAGGLAILTWLNSVPNDSRPFASIVEVFSQAHLLGVATPVWCVVLAVTLFVAAASKGFRRVSQAH